MTKKRKRKLLIWAIILLPIGYYAIFSCNVVTRLGHIEPKFENNELVFKLSYGCTNGLHNIIISDITKNNIYWEIDLNHYKGNKLKYGEQPQNFKIFNGEIINSEQIFPEVGQPAELVEDKIYLLHANWQYDKYITVYTESTEKYFKIINKDEIVFVNNPYLKKDNEL